MIGRKLVIAVVVGAGIAAIVPLAGSVGAGVTAATVYKVDAVHSSLFFHVRHMNVGYYNGRFNELSGVISIDDQNLGQTSFDLTINAGSIDTANAKRDQHLKNPDFFNARQYPKITFKSKSVSKSGENAYDVQGDLTLHGVTKPVTLKIEKTGQGKGPGGNAIGFETIFTIKRSDYGMDKMLEAIGDEVKITADIEATSGR